MRDACEVLVEFDGAITSADGAAYHARALGAPERNGLWLGWLEFVPARGDARGDAAAIETERETTQPNRDDLAYWATGLTRVYLEGALTRALDRARRPDRTFAGTPRAIP